jgi:hypothetical protein
MLKSWMRDLTLSIQARSGVTPALFVWLAVIALALLTAFAFLCVAGYVWATTQLGAVFAGLAMAGVFLLIALIGAIVFAVSRRRARQRAVMERAARAQASSSWLLDPKVLGVAMQAGSTIGWERVIPAALLAFLAAQWLLRDRHQNELDGQSDSSGG